MWKKRVIIGLLLILSIACAIGYAVNYHYMQDPDCGGG